MLIVARYYFRISHLLFIYFRLMDCSVFMDKLVQPAYNAVHIALGETFHLWQEIVAHTQKQAPEATGAWHFGGAKYGWSYRITDKKRIIVYLLPRAGYFKVAFVFGDKALGLMAEHGIPIEIIEELMAAKKYAEGRGIRIEITQSEVVPAICKLINLKVATR